MNVIQLPMDEATEARARLNNAEHAARMAKTMLDMQRARIKELEEMVETLKAALDEQLNDELNAQPADRRTA
jgi:hypothetical protein